ncbi:YeiH family protein [Senegalia massiliensis]|uniref:YeiH family protein n=1 Tax=Senegalia massiliensis TaxID=1720316 RepID=UPI0010317B84|nr:putative sulfate exporter family transporter [Senegalia massiliensis]
MFNKSIINKIVDLIPGIFIALLIATIAKFIENLLPIHLIGASVIALFIGMFINSIIQPKEIIKPGLKFTSKKILKFAIILLGLSLSINTVLTVGKLSLVVMFFTLLTCFGGGYVVGRLLKLNWKLSNLISAGTGICGGSAIAAIAPVIEAENKDIAYAMSATFLFDILMILLFPIMGEWMGLSDMAYGLWTGTAVNDTSSVVAAGYAFSESAGDFATMVKLTRTISIIPVVAMFAFINSKIKKKELYSKESVININPKANITSVFPWFILAFIGLAIINSFGIIPDTISIMAKEISKFLMISALAAIGLNTNFNEMKKSGVAPMIHGFTISALVVIVSITVQYFMGLV